MTGRSVYWENLFRAGCRTSRPMKADRHKENVHRDEMGFEDQKAEILEGGDATFVLLSFFWYAAYSWDESLEALYSHICTLVSVYLLFLLLLDGLSECHSPKESQVITANDLEMTNELHVIQAHLLHFESLLEDFKLTIEFVLNTPNPAMDKVERSLDGTDGDEVEVDLEEAEFEEKRREFSRRLLHRESHNLLSEVARLERQRTMMEKRLQNVMDLVCAFPFLMGYLLIFLCGRDLRLSTLKIASRLKSSQRLL